MADALSPIQTAFKSALSGDATLTGLVGGRIYNDVPDVPVYPYILIGSGTQRPWHTLGGSSVGLGWNATMTVHIYSRYQGDREALGILARVVDLLNFSSLTIGSYVTSMCFLDQARVLTEPIEKIETRHVPAVFRLLLS
jgi:hypothetical protein